MTQDIFLRTVRMLVDHFDQKLNILCNMKMSVSQAMKADLLMNRDGSQDFVDKIQHILSMPHGSSPLDEAAILGKYQNDAIKLVNATASAYT